MDLREMIQRRLGKKSSTKDGAATVKPDPPAQNEGDVDDETKPPSSLLKSTPSRNVQVRKSQSIELGTIQYCNITQDGRHGDFNTVLQIAALHEHKHKPIFANFVEWSG
jgi:hypothetical protein